MVVYYLIFGIVWNKDRIYINTELKLVLIWLITCLISGFAAKDQSIFIERIITLSQLVIFFIAGYLIILRGNIKIEHIFATIIISAVFVLLLGIFQQQKPSVIIPSSRLTSTAGNPNVLALFGSIALIFSLYLLSIAKNRFVKLVLFTLQLIIIIGIVLTESRKGFIALPLSIMIYFFVSNYKKIIESRHRAKTFMRVGSYFLILIIVIFTGFQFIKNTEYYGRFESMTRYLDIAGESGGIKALDLSVYQRQQFIRYGFQMWKDNPIIGVGLGNFRSNIGKYWSLSPRSYAHNNYIQLLSTTGFLGFLAYYSIYLFLFIKLFYIQNKFQLREKDSIVINIFLTLMFILVIIELAMVSYSTKIAWLLIMMISAFSDRILAGASSLQINKSAVSRPDEGFNR
ncbi:MAG: O-antigen ligase family protein [bacterium]